MNQRSRPTDPPCDATPARTGGALPDASGGALPGMPPRAVAAYDGRTHALHRQTVQGVPVVPARAHGPVREAAPGAGRRRPDSLPAGTSGSA
ncbi:hypothetical protein MTQ10_10960 [Streptomyces sp. XM83C]|uniref:hypothetical protein n=1 Tax=unclassified Streptomyces TaxID=2593676 RepID=UPI001FFB8173|nr:hypothetical protein [Streptomyces sp. XM83C]MCK1820126.1 hypothetical protein [Streptomyces sp. XM83C]